MIVRIAAGILLPYWLVLGAAQPQSERNVSVNLGIGIAGPGEQASVPVALSTGGPSRVGRIVFGISLPKQFVSFHSAIKGPAAESSELDIRAELQEQAEQNILRVELSSSSPIPEGEVVELKFDVSKEAQVNDEFSLKSLGQKVQTLEGEVLEAGGSDGLITVAVMGETIPACFFYMH